MWSYMVTYGTPLPTGLASQFDRDIGHLGPPRAPAPPSPRYGTQDIWDQRSREIYRNSI